MHEVESWDGGDTRAAGRSRRRAVALAVALAGCLWLLAHASAALAIGPPPIRLTVTGATSAGQLAIGGSVHDTATLVHGNSPSGSVEFDLYGPDDSTCSSAPVATETVPIDFAVTVIDSPDVTPAVPGTYEWVANYSGDANNAALSTACDDAGQSFTVTAAAPSIAATASAGVTVGGTVNDVSTLSGSAGATGAIDFSLYGPDDPSCTGTPVTTVSTTVSGDGAYTSPDVTTTDAGTYQWVASYPGDADDDAASTTCGDASQSVTVSPATPALSATASPGVTLGDAVHDAATLSGGAGATGTIDFTLYGPGDATCAGTPATSASVPVSGDGAYASPDFTPLLSGDYRWIASYAGDANNDPVATTCGDAAQSVTVTPASEPPPPPTTTGTTDTPPPPPPTTTTTGTTPMPAPPATTGSTPPPPPVPSRPAPRPRIASFTVTPRCSAAPRKGSALAPLTARFRLSTRATVTYEIQTRRLDQPWTTCPAGTTPSGDGSSGPSAGSGAPAPTGTATPPPPRQWRTLLTARRTTAAGAVSVAFGRRFAARAAAAATARTVATLKLAPGSYRLVVTAATPAGTTHKIENFVVLAPKPAKEPRRR